MMNGLIGGMKLSVVLSTSRSGSCETGKNKKYGTIASIITGVTRLWASRRSFTAAPIAPSSDANMK